MSQKRSCSSDWENTRLAREGSWVQIPASPLFYIKKIVDQSKFCTSEMDLNTISMEKINMAGYEASIAVWIPLIVGLAPGLVYWFAITGMRKRR